MFFSFKKSIFEQFKKQKKCPLKPCKSCRKSVDSQHQKFKYLKCHKAIFFGVGGLSEQNPPAGIVCHRSQIFFLIHAAGLRHASWLFVSPERLFKFTRSSRPAHFRAACRTCAMTAASSRTRSRNRM